MSFCFGFLSNDAALTGCAMEPFASALVLPEGAPHGWGLSYYQEGRPLQKKIPKPHPEPLDFLREAGSLRTNLVLGHVRPGNSGGQRTENTQPFRYRSWTFCHCGSLDRFEAVRESLLRSTPDFLRRNIRGKTDSEHLFYLLLSFLNDTGRLEDPRVRAGVVAQALESTLSYLDRLIRDAGGAPHVGCCLVTNGTFIVGGRRGGAPLKVKRQGSFNCPDAGGKQLPVPHLKAVVVAGGRAPQTPGWEDVADGATVTVNSQLDIETRLPE
jgi:glutamine amidotransferase